MAIDYSSDQLITDIRSLGMLPDAQALLTDDQLISFFNFQMKSVIVPLIDSAAEEFFVTYRDIPYDQSTTRYKIPERAVGSKLRDVVFVDNNRNEIAVPRLRPEDLKVGYRYGIGYNIGLYGFFLKDDTMNLYLGNPSGINSYPFLRLKYFRRPSNIVSTNACSKIIAINTGLNTVTIAQTPAGWTTSLTYDFVKGTPHFTTKGDDLTITTLLSNTLTFTAPLPTDLVIGDWVALSNTSPIPQIPYDAFPLLEQLTVFKALEANRDTEGMKNALATIEDLKKGFLQIVTPRVDGSVVKVAGRSGISNWI